MFLKVKDLNNILTYWCNQVYVCSHWIIWICNQSFVSQSVPAELWNCVFLNINERIIYVYLVCMNQSYWSPICIHNVNHVLSRQPHLGGVRHGCLLWSCTATQPQSTLSSSGLFTFQGDNTIYMLVGNLIPKHDALRPQIGGKNLEIF